VPAADNPPLLCANRFRRDVLRRRAHPGAHALANVESRRCGGGRFRYGSIRRIIVRLHRGSVPSRQVRIRPWPPLRTSPVRTSWERSRTSIPSDTDSCRAR
jgi:hypothetical protein